MAWKKYKNIAAKEAKLRAEIGRLKQELAYKREFEEYKQLRKVVHPSKLSRLLGYAIKAEHGGVKAYKVSLKAKKGVKRAAKDFGL